MTSAAPGSAPWRVARRAELLAFAERSRVAGGFAWLDDAGRQLSTADLELWITARMTYVFSLATLVDDGRSASLAAHGVASLDTTFRDPEHGGWFSAVGPGTPADDAVKDCYGHSFVVLAAATAATAGVPDAAALLHDALAVHDEHFWDESVGACRESWDRAWTTTEAYRGANSTMHTVEAYLAAADATGDSLWRDRAVALCSRIVPHARANGWRLPEHYDPEWHPLLDYNAERPADAFRPFGATPGHALEWARLLVSVEAALDTPPSWLREAAAALFARAVDDCVGPGSVALPYTTDWEGVPVVAERFHWVMCEAVLGADALHAATGDDGYAALAARWWRDIAEHFVDPATGSWHHELSPTMGRSSRTWSGKPDAYHAMNALTLPDLALAPSAAAALVQGRRR